MNDLVAQNLAGLTLQNVAEPVPYNVSAALRVMWDVAYNGRRLQTINGAELRITALMETWREMPLGSGGEVYLDGQLIGTAKSITATTVDAQITVHQYNPHAKTEAQAYQEGVFDIADFHQRLYALCPAYVKMYTKEASK